MGGPGGAVAAEVGVDPVEAGDDAAVFGAGEGVGVEEGVEAAALQQGPAEPDFFGAVADFGGADVAVLDAFEGAAGLFVAGVDEGVLVEDVPAFLDFGDLVPVFGAAAVELAGFAGFAEGADDVPEVFEVFLAVDGEEAGGFVGPVGGDVVGFVGGALEVLGEVGVPGGGAVFLVPFAEGELVGEVVVLLFGFEVADDE